MWFLVGPALCVWPFALGGVCRLCATFTPPFGEKETKKTIGTPWCNLVSREAGRLSGPCAVGTMSEAFVLKPIEGHFRAVFSPEHASSPSIRDVAAYVAAALRSSFVSEPKLLFLASRGNVVTVITFDQALSNSICQRGVALAHRLCSPPSVVSRLHIANAGGIHSSHIREMLSAFSEVKSLRMITTVKGGSEPVYGTSALATVIANTAIPASMMCEVDGLRLTLTISSSSFASAALRRPDGKEPALPLPPAEDAKEHVPLSPSPARVACRDWVRGTCRRGATCRFTHANSSPKSGVEAAQLRPPGEDLEELSERLPSPSAPARVACRDWARGACKRGAACHFAHTISLPKPHGVDAKVPCAAKEPTPAVGPFVHPQRRAFVGAVVAAPAAVEPGVAEAAGWQSVPSRRAARRQRQRSTSAGPRELACSGLSPPSKRHSAAPLQGAELEDGGNPALCPPGCLSADDELEDGEAPSLSDNEAPPCPARTSSPTPAKSEDLAVASSRQ